ncbi:protein kinase family protein, partial [Streptomyces sp. JAC18]
GTRVVSRQRGPPPLAGWRAAPRNPAVSEGGDGSPFRWVEKALMDGADFMSSRGLVHFDAHFANILTDGRQLYFADFGLALSSRFDLSSGESSLLSDHLAYDRCYTASHLLQYHLLDG